MWCSFWVALRKGIHCKARLRISDGRSRIHGWSAQINHRQKGINHDLWLICRLGQWLIWGLIMVECGHSYHRNVHGWHGFHGYPWMPWISMDSMDIHGIHGYPWNPWISMESMDIHGFHGYPWSPWKSMDIHGIHGYQWNPWISMLSEIDKSNLLKNKWHTCPIPN